jgi:hypothetical protein
MIESICKKNNILYKSANPLYTNAKEDALKMRDIYLKIKEIIETLLEIEERHNLIGLRKQFENIIKELDDADHSVIRLAREIKND